MLDEWSTIPLDLQPFLADLLRRCFFSINNITVKIAAIEQRTQLQTPLEAGHYIGIELGSDAQANLNLDDFMVFDNDEARAKEFFKELLFKNFRASEDLGEDEGPKGGHELIALAFTQITAFEEFVRSVEGVPRDAINIIEAAAQRAYEDRISVIHIRQAAHDWYVRDKTRPIQDDQEAFGLLTWIIDEVIGHRRARAFLLRTDRKNQIVEKLFDARLIHLLKRSVATKDEPGVRYAVFKLDYGRYVDLINTQKQPLGLLDADRDEGPGYVDVPPDDYRSIRRAILK